MNGLRKVLSGEAPPNIYVLDDEIPAEEIRTLVEESGFNFLWLDGEMIHREEDFFTVAESALRFPYFGRNWDAFDDCVRDMSWLPLAQGNIILYNGFERFLRQDPEGFKMAFYGLRLAATTDLTPQPAYVLLKGDPHALIGLGLQVKIL